jgi:cephalosporin-C deacetylase
MYRSLYLDTVQITRIVMDFPEVDKKRVGVTGGSQGGGLTLACASLEPRIKYVAPVFPFLSDFKRVWDMDLDLDAYKELRTYFRQYDPHHKNLVNRIKGKVLMAITLLDNICPPSTQFAAYNRITSEKKNILYYDYGHEHLPGMDDYIFSFFMEMLN